MLPITEHMDLELGRFLLKNKAPNGPIFDPNLGEWEIAYALNAMIQDINPIESERQRGIKFAEAFWKFWHALHYLESFDYLLEVAGSKFQASDFKATDEFLDLTQEALEKDIALFKTPKPTHLRSIDSWKYYETYRMLQEMDMHRIDEYEKWC